MSLHTEVERFKQWAEERKSPDFDASYCHHFESEWECDYPHWDDLYEAAEERIRNSEPFSIHEIDDLLYSLARDNEDERIMDTLSENPRALFELCDARDESKERDARWQLALALGQSGKMEAEDRIKHLQKDDEEYVRRRAGFALEDLYSRNKTLAQPDGADNGDKRRV